MFSVTWDDRRRFLIVGGQAVINIFRVDLNEARKTSQQQRSVASGTWEHSTREGTLGSILGALQQ